MYFCEHVCARVSICFTFWYELNKCGPQGTARVPVRTLDLPCPLTPNVGESCSWDSGPFGSPLQVGVFCVQLPISGRRQEFPHLLSGKRKGNGGGGWLPTALRPSFGEISPPRGVAEKAKGVKRPAHPGPGRGHLSETARPHRH